MSRISSLAAARCAARCFHARSQNRNVMAEIDKQLNPREIIDRKRKLFEEKYGDKLKRKAEAEGVQDLDALKVKVMAPSIRSAFKRKAPDPKQEGQTEEVRKASEVLADGVDRKRAARSISPDAGDSAGIKPLSSILNLPLLHLTPHDADAISKIWTTYHLSHATLSSSYLSASLSSVTYESMLALAKENPFFVLPLPRASADSASGAVKTDEYDMFYLQWLFHPTPSSTPSSASATTALPATTSIIFTPLEEFKKSGEWASPFLVLTHYPDLSQSHDLVLMRGEITAQAATGPVGSLANPGWLLSQQQAQLLALALQRFYCSEIAPSNETADAAKERGERRKALRGFREHPEKWDWTKLVGMAYGGMV